MKGKAVYKVPNGKLLRILLEFEDNVILGIKIMGDFFLHPEESIEKIEANLIGKPINETLALEIEKTIKKEGIELFGVNSQSLAEAIKIAGANTNGRV